MCIPIDIHIYMCIYIHTYVYANMFLQKSFLHMHIRITCRSSRHDMVMGGYSFFHDDHGGFSRRDLLRLSHHGYVHIYMYDTHHELEFLCIYHRCIKCVYIIHDDHGSFSRRDLLRLSHYG
jgi:hypothetical protein